MSFLAPGWFGTAMLGVLAASIPVIIHFLFKSRYRVVPWAAMQFLRKSLEKTTRRIKFQELLLLLIRVGLIVLVVFALMRPSSARHSGQAGTPVDAIFIFDASGSMAIPEAGQTRLEWAKVAGLKILDSLPPHSTLHILRADRHTEDLGPASATNRDQARYVIEQLEQTHGSASLLNSMREATEILQRGALPNKEVYLFSDMQRHNWEEDGPGISAVCEELQQIGEVVLVHAGQRTMPANATLFNLRPQLAMPTIQERFPFTVEVRNTGEAELQGLTVTLRTSGNDRDVDTQPVPPLQPGQTVAITLTTRLQRQGRNIVTAELQGDQLSIDNRVDFLVQSQDQVKVLIVDGRWNETDPVQSSSYYLAHALRSTKQIKGQDRNEQVQLTVVGKSTAYPGLLADVQFCFLVGLTDSQDALSEEFVKRLSDFTQSGGGVVLFAGGGKYSSGLETWTALPCELGRSVEHPEQDPLRFDVQSIPRRSFLSAFRLPPLSSFTQTETTKATALINPRSDAQTILKYSNGQNAIVAGSYGRGSVVVVSPAADLHGTDAALRPSYVPFIQALVGHILTQQTGNRNLIAGDRYVCHPSLDLARHRLRLVGPSGASRVLEPPKGNNLDGEIASGPISQAGVYRVLPDVASAEESGSDTANSGDTFVVVPDPNETVDLTTLTEEQLNARFSRPAVHLKANDLTVNGLDEARLRSEWTETILWILLIVTVLELSFAWFCNRAL